MKKNKESKSKIKTADIKTPLFNREGRIDVLIPVAAIIIVIFGVIMVYSASFYQAEYNYGDKFFYMKKQLIGAVLGIASMFFMSFIDYRKLMKLQYIGMLVSIILLILVFVPGIGVENYGAKRWIGLPGFTLQSSEVAKFGFILFASAYMAKNSKKMHTFLGIIPVIIAGAVLCVLIILEPNMSITMCVGLLMLAMLFIGGARIKHFVLIALPIIAMVPVLIIMEPYRMNRLLAFLNPWASPQGEGFQLIQSLYSLGSGGWFGVGLFNSRQKYMFLPFSESDFIFSIIGEELGLFGACMVLFIFFFLIYRLVRAAVNAPDKFGCFFASGTACVIAIQVLINIAVVTGSIPPTGLPLPLVSAGSSSLIVMLSGIGIVMNISRNKKGKTTLPQKVSF